MFLNRGNSQYAILSSVVYSPSCSVTISLSDYWASHRTANVVDRLKGSMNSRGAALAALTAASALLAYVVFRKREPEAKKLEEVVLVEQEEVKEKVEPHQEVKNNEEQEKVEDECLEESAEIGRGKESLMEWIDRQLEEAERKTGGSPWPEIPQEEGVLTEAGGETSHGDGAVADPDEFFDGQMARDLSDVKRDLKEAEDQLLGPAIRLDEAIKGIPSQEGKYKLSGEITGSADEREDTQQCTGSSTLLADDPKHSLDVVLEGSLKPESNIGNSNARKEDKSIDNASLGGKSPSCTIENDQFDMSSDSEIELLKEPSLSDEDNEMGQLLDETESEGENTEEITRPVVTLKNETSDLSKMGGDTVEDTPDELITLRPAWQKNLPNKS